MPGLSYFLKLLGAAHFFALLGSAPFGMWERALVWNAGLLISFFFTLFKIPSRIYWLLPVSIFADFFVLLPDAPNHRHLLFFLALAVFPACLGKVDYERWTAPVIRWTTLIVYFFAFSAKLNYGYLDPETSCAPQFYGNMVSQFPFLPAVETVSPFIIYSSVILEGLFLPLLFFYSGIGVLLAQGFHSVLALDFFKYFINFSGVMMACLFTFVPTGSVQKALGKFDKGAKLLYPFLLFLFTVVLAFRISPWGQHFLDVGMFSKLGFSLWFIVSLLFMILLVAILFDDGFRTKVDFKVPGWGYLILFFVVLNGLSPYLGLKTRTSFNMYSNMVMRSDSSNHLFVPKSLDIFSFLKEVESGKPPKGIVINKLASFRSPKPGSAGKCVW